MAQFKQKVEFALEANVFGLQGVQIALELENDPGGQNAQAALPTELEDPGGHCQHAVWFISG